MNEFILTDSHSNVWLILDEILGRGYNVTSKVLLNTCIVKDVRVSQYGFEVFCSRLHTIDKVRDEIVQSIGDESLRAEIRENEHHEYFNMADEIVCQYLKV